MSRFLDGITVRIKESVDSSTVMKAFDHKAFERIRNFGQVLVHEEAGVVIEFFDHQNRYYTPLANSLKKYHQPHFVYALKTRKTALIFTYDVAYAVSKAYPNEPFQDLDAELIYSKPYKVICKEPKVIEKLQHERSLGTTRTLCTMEPDGILLNDSHAGLFSSMNSFDNQLIREFHQTCMGLYYFQKYTEDKGKIYDLWRSMFNKKVMLYLGFRCPLSAQQIEHCRSLNIRPLSWEKDRLVLL
ncbi:putative protein-like protein [Perkinsela sp. CCAP 1560/4]|nr:putative protein-like protein [Perkinsela sp. CCAP 1560/4]|eukprot:KNH06472.1 putative protein-like protein [Perkinsela sp. CCAP 1560/4]